jgi:putative GTP pyrophosphokinase
MTVETVIETYDRYVPSLEQVRTVVHHELASLLDTDEFKIQLIASRVKDPISLRSKIARPDKTYHTLWDVTDLVGIRVITYFEHTIENVAKIIESRFNVDFTNSTNKLNLASFGYKSLHYVCALPEHERSKLDIPAPFRFEIQVRTVLQHAWAEIEHDLGYKAQEAIPHVIRRRFSRVASLLEIADQEFGSILAELSSYREALSSPALHSQEQLLLDTLTLESVAHQSDVRILDEVVAQFLDRELSQELFYPAYLLKMLNVAGISRVEELRECVSRYSGEVASLLPRYFAFAAATWNLSARSIPLVYRGYSLVFVAHLHVLNKGLLGVDKVTHLTQFYHQLDYPEDIKAAARVAGELYQYLDTVKRG